MSGAKIFLRKLILGGSLEEGYAVGVGNAGDAEFWGYNAQLNLPLDGYIEHGLLELNYTYRDSSFDDPVSGSNRGISWYAPDRLNVEFRQDLSEQKLTWGINYWGNFIDSSYRVNERQTFQGNKRLKVFIETTRFFDVKTRLEINDLNTGRFTRTRYIHGGSRKLPLDRIETAHRTRSPILDLVCIRFFLNHYPGECSRQRQDDRHGRRKCRRCLERIFCYRP